MAGAIIPFVKSQWFDNNGDPAAGDLLFSYAAGTTTKIDTFSDEALSVPNSNPIVLDSAGRASVYLSGTDYKFVLADSTSPDPPTSPIWVQDGVTASSGGGGGGSSDIVATAGENLAASDAIYLSDGSGGKTAGKWYKADADFTYASVNAAAIGFAPSAIVQDAVGTARLTGRITGLSSLTTGAVYYISATAGAVTISPPANSRAIGQADSTTSLVLAGSLPPAVATATVPGIVSIVAQSYGGLKTFTAGLQSDIPLTFRPPGGAGYIGVPGKLTAIYATVGNIGAGEDTLMTYTLPASTLSVDGMAVKVIAWGHSANNANAKTLKAYFGAQQLIGGAGAILNVSEAGSWQIGFTVLRSGAAAQRAVCTVTCGPTGSTVTQSVNGNTLPAETLSGTVVIKVTGTATADNDVTQEGMIVSLVV